MKRNRFNDEQIIGADDVGAERPTGAQGRLRTRGPASGQRNKLGFP